MYSEIKLVCKNSDCSLESLRLHVRVTNKVGYRLDVVRFPVTENLPNLLEFLCFQFLLDFIDEPLMHLGVSLQRLYQRQISSKGKDRTN